MAVPTAQVPGVGTVHLGRAIPRAVMDFGRFRVVFRQDGTQGVSPRFGFSREAPTAPPPASVDWGAKAAEAIARMYRNNVKGCCVVSSAGHQFGLWTANESGTPALATDAEIDQQYARWCGPGDNGCDISAVNDVIRDHGMMLGGVNYKIDGYASVDNTKPEESKVCITEFGSLKLGIDLPGAWANTNDGALWDVTDSRTVGGHDVPCLGYNDVGVEIATWGGKRRITWEAWASRRYITECYVSLPPAWYAKANLSPYGISADQLKADLAKIEAGGVPVLPDTYIDYFA